MNPSKLSGRILPKSVDLGMCYLGESYEKIIYIKNEIDC